jgi:RimJ/RimL family protein N-acetyltransferase
MARAPVPEIEAERVLLRALTSADVPELADFFADPEAIRFLPKRNLTPVARAERAVSIFAACWEQPVGKFAIAARTGGHFMGTCGAEPIAGTRDWEIDYSVVRPYWGQGFTTEPVQALWRHGVCSSAWASRTRKT